MNFFCDQSKVVDRFASLPSDSSFRSVILCNVFTTEREVNHLLKTVGVAKACGPDGTGNSAYSQTLFSVVVSPLRFQR